MTLAAILSLLGLLKGWGRSVGGKQHRLLNPTSTPIFENAVATRPPGRGERRQQVDLAGERAADPLA